MPIIIRGRISDLFWRLPGLWTFAWRTGLQIINSQEYSPCSSRPINNNIPYLKVRYKWGLTNGTCLLLIIIIPIFNRDTSSAGLRFFFQSAKLHGVKSCEKLGILLWSGSPWESDLNTPVYFAYKSNAQLLHGMVRSPLTFLAIHKVWSQSHLITYSYNPPPIHFFLS